MLDAHVPQVQCYFSLGHCALKFLGVQLRPSQRSSTEPLISEMFDSFTELPNLFYSNRIVENIRLMNLIIHKC